MIIDDSPLRRAKVLQSILKAQGFTVSGVEHSGAVGYVEKPLTADRILDVLDPLSYSSQLAKPQKRAPKSLESTLPGHEPDMYARRTQSLTNLQEIDKNGK